MKTFLRILTALVIVAGSALLGVPAVGVVAGALIVLA